MTSACFQQLHCYHRPLLLCHLSPHHVVPLQRSHLHPHLICPLNSLSIFTTKFQCQFRRIFPWFPKLICVLCSMKASVVSSANTAISSMSIFSKATTIHPQLQPLQPPLYHKYIQSSRKRTRMPCPGQSLLKTCTHMSSETASCSYV